MDSSINSNFFKGNRAKLLKSLSVDILVLTANGLMQKSADQAFPFRQDSNFWYLTGINEPDLILVITKEEEFLIAPDFYLKVQAITGDVDNSLIAKQSGIRQILKEKEGWQKIRSILTTKSKIATLLPSPAFIRHYAIYTSPARRRLLTKIKRQFPGIEIIDARRQLALQRMVKQEVEIKLIKRAIDITTDTLSDVLAADKLAQYKDTGEIERAILSGFTSRGGTGHAFDPIVAAGPNAAYIHFSELAIPLKQHQLIVCDVGSGYSFYGADITRTVACGEPSSRQQEVFNAVKQIQSEAYKLIKPGIKMKEYEHQVEQLVGRQLKDLGLIPNLSRKNIRKYYPHACSHSLGLDTHDVADYSVPLPEDMIMTVEPGIYIKEEGIGVRLEDIVRITKDSCEVLSSSLKTGLKL